KTRSVPCARSLAIVVLPQPGGPQRIIDDNLRFATIRPIGASRPSRWSCPTTSARLRGRSRSARGCGAWCSNNVLTEPLSHLIGQPRQVVGGVAEGVLNDHAAAEIMPDRIFLGHADPTIQLHRVLRQQFTRLADADLCHRDI